MTPQRREGERVIVSAFELEVLAPEPVIGIDVDGVMFPVMELVVLPELRRQGFRVKLEDLTVFDLNACLTASEARAAYKVFKNSYLYDGWNLTKAESRILQQLRNKGRVVAVSSPFVQHAGSKWHYCLRAGFSHQDIVLCGDKDLVMLDILVDDSPANILSRPAEQTIVFDRPWNQEITDRVRVHSFSEIPAAVDLLLEERQP